MRISILGNMIKFFSSGREFVPKVWPINYRVYAKRSYGIINLFMVKYIYIQHA